MIIGTKKLLELVNDPNIRLVEGLCERELTNPEGEGFDFRVGELYEIIGKKGFLGNIKRLTPEIRTIASYDSNFSEEEQTTVTIEPGDYLLLKTLERINLPYDISLRFEPRTTLQRSGIFFRSSNASPGYSGELTFALKNEGPVEFGLQMGARICTAIFEETSENISGYRGQWNGGRVSTQGVHEKQV